MSLVFRALSFVAALGLLGVGSGCTGPALPLSAQAGSTVVLTFSGGDNTTVQPVVNAIAYGGEDWDDPQRGSLVVQLDELGGFELVTRLALAAAPPVESPIGPGGGGAQVVGLGSDTPLVLMLIVDIPENAPVGTHSLVVVQRRSGEPDLPLDPSPHRLDILPHEVASTAGLIEGVPTPSEWWGGIYGFQPFIGEHFGNGVINNFFETAIPEPSFGVAVTAHAQVGAPPRFVSYARMSVTYPPGVIDIKRVVSTRPTHSLVWSDDDGAGNLSITGIITQRGDTSGVAPFRVVFGLDDPATTRLTLDDINVTFDQLLDQYGDEGIEADLALVPIESRIR